MKKSLAMQHRGGLANQRGNAFEDHFAVWRCLEALRAFEQGIQRRRLATQLRGAFVDDWVEKHGVDRHHYQLKRKHGVSWTEVASDFVQQLGTAKSVSLVVHSRKAQGRLLRSKKRVVGATVLYFPGSIHPKDVMKFVHVAQALTAACVKAPPTAADLKLVWAVIATEWKNTQKPGHFVGIDRVVDRLSDPHVPVRVPWRRPPAWSKARKLLSAIPGLSWWVEGGHFFFEDGAGTRGRVSSRSSDFVEFVRLVVQGRITTADDVGAHL